MRFLSVRGYLPRILRVLLRGHMGIRGYLPRTRQRHLSQHTSDGPVHNQTIQTLIITPFLLFHLHYSLLSIRRRLSKRI